MLPITKAAEFLKCETLRYLVATHSLKAGCYNPGMVPSQPSLRRRIYTLALRWKTRTSFFIRGVVGLRNKIPAELRKPFLLGVGFASTLCFTVAMTISLTDPSPAIWWFSAAAAFALFFVFLVEEITSLSRGWRIATTSLAVLVILILVWVADSWVAKKAEEPASFLISQAANVSKLAVASKVPLLPPPTKGPAEITKGSTIRKPAVIVECHLSDSRSPCELECSIYNSGSIAVRDVTVAFLGFLPIQTRVAGPTDARIVLEKSETLPVPDPDGRMVRDKRAFTIRIPLIPPATKIPFTLWTDDDDNRRACEQVSVLTKMRREIFSDLFSVVRETRALGEAEIPDLDVLFSAIEKENSLFQPENVLSEIGRQPVAFMDHTESRSKELLRKNYPNLKKRFNSVWQNRAECMAPVFTVEKSDGGAVTFESFPPDVRTYIDGSFRLPREIPEDGVLFEYRPLPPPRYICREARR